jgi:hypothetical protein
LIATQVGIAVCGVTAIWLTQSESAERRRWACIFGLCSQPFWFAETYAAEQWGIFALSLLYAWGWWRGFVVHWLRPKEIAP